MIKRAAIFATVPYYGLASFAWSYDGVSVENRVNAIIWVLGPVITIIVLIGIVRELLPGPRRTVHRSYSAPNVKWTYNPPPPTYTRPTYQPPPTFAKTTYPAAPPTYARPAYQPAFWQGWVAETLYHGTRTRENAFDIADSGSGFIVGPGDAFGNGVYLADFRTARPFAQETGALVKVLLQAPATQIADLDSVFDSEGFANWCLWHSNVSEGENITNYVLTLRKRFIRVISPNQKIYVALANPTLGNERVVFQGVTVLGVLDAQGNPIQGG